MITVKGITRRLKDLCKRRKTKFLKNIELAKTHEDYQLKLMALRYLAHQLEKVVKHDYNDKVGLRGVDKAGSAKELLNSLKDTKYRSFPDVVWAQAILDQYDGWKTSGQMRRKSSFNGANKKKITFTELVYSRRSVRFWKDKKIDESILKEILQTGIMAPSSCNRQTWRFTIVRNICPGKSLVDNGVSNPSMISKAPYILYISIDQRMYSEVFSPAIDVGLVTQNILLAMESNNLGACPIYQCESYRQKRLRKVLGLSEYEYVYLALPFGVPDEEALTPSRVPVEEVLRFLDLEDPSILNVHY